MGCRGQCFDQGWEFQLSANNRRFIQGQCTPNLRVLPWYLLCSLGIFGDNLPINTHYVGLIYCRDFP